MVDIGIWDIPCRDKLNEALKTDEVVDGLTLMLFGANFATGQDFIEKLCGYERYISRVQQRIDSKKKDELDKSLSLALEKALSRIW